MAKPDYIEQAFLLIRAYRAELGSDRKLAQRAGLDHSVLSGMMGEGWNPRAATLRKLLAAVPANYKLGKSKGE